MQLFALGRHTSWANKSKRLLSVLVLFPRSLRWGPILMWLVLPPEISTSYGASGEELVATISCVRPITLISALWYIDRRVITGTGLEGSPVHWVRRLELWSVLCMLR